MKNKIKYGFVIPLESEAKFLLNKIEIIKDDFLFHRRLILAQLRNNNIVIMISGCGKIRTACATQFLIDKFKPKFLIHYGSAGGISSRIKIGDIIFATEVVEHDVKILFPKKIFPPVYKIKKSLIKEIKKIKNLNLFFGRIISGDKDIVNTKEKEKLFNKYKALSVDWESASFLLTCQINRKDALILRGVTDLAYENTAKEYKRNEKRVMMILTNKLMKIIDKLIL